MDSTSSCAHQSEEKRLNTTLHVFEHAASEAAADVESVLLPPPAAEDTHEWAASFILGIDGTRFM